MTTPPVIAPSSSPTVSQFQILPEAPPESEWCANLTNVNTQRAYRQDIEDFLAFAGLRHPEQFRTVTRAHVIAWRHLGVKQPHAMNRLFSTGSFK